MTEQQLRDLITVMALANVIDEAGENVNEVVGTEREGRLKVFITDTHDDIGASHEDQLARVSEMLCEAVDRLLASETEVTP